jgi:hypothetical protein
MTEREPTAGPTEPTPRPKPVKPPKPRKTERRRPGRKG